MKEEKGMSENRNNANKNIPLKKISPLLFFYYVEEKENDLVKMEGFYPSYFVSKVSLDHSS